ncbi:unnamed protein product [Acanthoscelides obtectus]|uniref:Uncharacterized protein n=1 Tax=Acanthoscelides obtectus TaxID=200917 RepID=A0A9P0K9R5_ACAOB|nr:unnamed protein product [Acanthoscelides obtectus]CAK1628174.1 hypothetical protein AOBTE_LOCUS5062 [Acanthoscelides obtectus]
MNQAPIPDEFPTEMMAPVQAPHPVFAPGPTLFPAPYPYPIQNVDQYIPMMQIRPLFYDATMNQPQFPKPPPFGYPAVLPRQMMAPIWVPHPVTIGPGPAPIPPVYPNPIRFRNQIVLKKRVRQRKAAPGARRSSDDTSGKENQPQPSTSGLAGAGSRYARTHTESTGSDISMFNPTGASTPRRRSNSGEQEENGASATAETDQKSSS